MLGEWGWGNVHTLTEPTDQMKGTGTEVGGGIGGGGGSKLRDEES